MKPNLIFLPYFCLDEKFTPIILREQGHNDVTCKTSQHSEVSVCTEHIHWY